MAETSPVIVDNRGDNTIVHALGRLTPETGTRNACKTRARE
jgi:hypothetical protein